MSFSNKGKTWKLGHDMDGNSQNQSPLWFWQFSKELFEIALNVKGTSVPRSIVFQGNMKGICQLPNPRSHNDSHMFIIAVRQIYTGSFLFLPVLSIKIFQKDVHPILPNSIIWTTVDNMFPSHTVMDMCPPVLYSWYAMIDLFSQLYDERPANNTALTFEW